MDALGLAQRTVHLDHAARAGALMQAVDVLGDDRTDPAALLELGEGAVTIVGLRAGSVVGKAADARPRRAPEAPWGRRERIEPERVELPDPRRVSPECVDGRDLGRVVPRPDAFGGAEVRNPRLGADAGAREHHTVAGNAGGQAAGVRPEGRAA